MAKDTIGIGMVGSGFMGLTYSEVVARHLPDARLVAICGGKRANALAAEYGVPAPASIDDLLAQPDLDAVILATPDQLRVELTSRAAAAGKHVLAEKPMAPTVAECDRMIAACRAAKVSLAVVKTERYRPLTLRAKQAIDEGQIGRIRMLRTISSFPISVTREISQSRGWMNEATSGGLFMGIATHNADFLRWLAGGSPRRVFALATTFDRDEPAFAGAGPQSVMAQLEFDHDIQAHLWISSEFPTPGLPASEVRFQVVGSEGILDFENFEYLDLGKGDKWERIFTPAKFDYLKEPKSPIRLAPHIGVVREFVESIREGRPPRVGGAEGRAAVEICQACLVSARERRVVDLPLT